MSEQTHLIYIKPDIHKKVGKIQDYFNLHYKQDFGKYFTQQDIMAMISLCGVKEIYNDPKIEKFSAETFENNIKLRQKIIEIIKEKEEAK